MITKDVICPIPDCCEVFEADFDPTDPDQEIDCPECHATLVVEYDAATDTVTLTELEEEDQGPDDLSLVEDEEEEETENE